ncbi:MAG: GGDEF domain-containing phosphodiesterase [Oscillospiraceae bacterium]|nr:GGDEF domain-containing phosphodiesterase [Oscillospiraceae bacterium]
MESCGFGGCVLDFWGKISANTDDIGRAVLCIRQALGDVAENIRLGRAVLSVRAASDKIKTAGLGYTELYTSPAGYEDSAVTVSTVSKQGGVMSVSVCPEKGTEWNDGEKQAMELLAKTCCLLCSRAKAVELMEEAKFIDNLTGVANTDGFTRYVGMLAAKGELVNYAAAFMNIKNFKYVNKVYGSGQGDKLLKQFAESMSKFIGTDGKFARLGGDNFILLIKKGRVNDLRVFIDALSFEMGEGEITQAYDLRLRMGIYEACQNDTVSDIMNKSSIAYINARSDRVKDVVYFSPLLLEESNHRKTISTLFPKALEKREFAVDYQPKVSLDDNKLCGCEALCRWIRDGKVVPPMEFIPVLESEGSVCRLDFYVLERVCEDIKGWLDAGIEPVKVSVNFSKNHLHNKRLADQIIGIIKKYGIGGKYLEIELTEMTGSDDLNAMSVFVDVMKENGVGTSIDDFGTGYSSLNLLKDLDVDVIKLDKSFFTNINEADGGISTDRIVIKNIVNMVNELNMEAISEGVETKSQADFLRNVNCSMAQGFLFDRPLPKGEFETRLTDGEFYTDKG